MFVTDDLVNNEKSFDRATGACVECTIIYKHLIAAEIRSLLSIADVTLVPYLKLSWQKEVLSP